MILEFFLTFLLITNLGVKLTHHLIIRNTKQIHINLLYHVQPISASSLYQRKNKLHLIKL